MKLTKHDIKRIDGIARRVRLKFPCSAGACYYSSIVLMKALNHAGYFARMVHGTFYLDNPNIGKYNYDVDENQAKHATHYWVQIGAVIIDTTADQFVDEVDGEHIPKVVIGKAAALWRYEPKGDYKLSQFEQD